MPAMDYRFIWLVISNFLLSRPSAARLATRLFILFEGIYDTFSQLQKPVVRKTTNENICVMLTLIVDSGKPSCEASSHRRGLLT